MTEYELNKWRLRMNVGATSPATQSAANDFISSAELNDLYELAALTAEENGWEIPTRGEFEARYRKEVATRDKRE